MDPVDALQTSADLASIIADISQGKIPDPHDTAKVLLRVANTLGAADALREHLTPRDAAEVDAEIEDAIRKKFGG